MIGENIIELNSNLAYKILWVFYEGNLLIKLFLIFLFVSAINEICSFITVILCYGYNSSYYLLFRNYKIPYGKLVQRKIFGNFVDYLVPNINLVRFFEFLQNLFKNKELQYD